jgi:DNA polymerase III epsilon subunit-like protein
MLDTETLGLDPQNDDIIQIGILECIKNSKGLFIPARSFNKILFTDQEPSDFIKNMHKELLPKSRATEYEPPVVIRAQILNFFKQCGVTDKAEIVGLNVMSFDLPFMLNKGYLTADDYNFRVFELRGAYKIAEEILGVDSKGLFKLAHSAADWYDMPTGSKHEAIFDCHQQLRTLNGIIPLLKK